VLPVRFCLELLGIEDNLGFLAAEIVEVTFRLVAGVVDGIGFVDGERLELVVSIGREIENLAFGEGGRKGDVVEFTVVPEDWARRAWVEGCRLGEQGALK